MKRKTNIKMMFTTFMLIMTAYGICYLSAVHGSIYIKTKGTPSVCISNLFDSFFSGKGDECIKYTDSYKKILLDASNENDAVKALCNALLKNYSYAQSSVNIDETRSLQSYTTIQFTTIDLRKIRQDVSLKFDEYLSQTLKGYADTESIILSDGKYLPEIYEEAYLMAISDLLQNPTEYYTDKELQLESAYNTQAGKWEVRIDHNLASLLLGCLEDGTSSDTLSLPDTLSIYIENSIRVLMGDVPNISGKYSLPYSSTIGPKPIYTNYTHISIDQASNVLDIIDKARASGLLGDQTMIFNTNADFYPEDIVCYFDNSILVICWKEYINGCVCNCMEVKIADGSQIKRKLTGDSFNSGTLDTMTNMSAACNAVAAINGDYYAYRDIGVSVYQGVLNRYQLSCEVLMINDKGRFVFYYTDNKSSSELQEYITNENIQFSLAFGPILIDNYTPRYYTDGYAHNLGEMKESYSRAAFGEYDDLHYLFMTSGYAEDINPPENLDAFIEILRTKNLKNAYNVDGGQTAEMVIQNKPYNQIDYGGERQVSDMVFFATAMQEDIYD